MRLNTVQKTPNTDIFHAVKNAKTRLNHFLLKSSVGRRNFTEGRIFEKNHHSLNFFRSKEGHETILTTF